MNDIAFLGTRVDPEAEPLPTEFTDAMIGVRGAIMRWLEGSASDTETLERIAGFAVLDDDGRQWAYGATTGRWYVKTAAGWEPSHPTLSAVAAS